MEYIADWIEPFYNRIRLYLTSGNLTSGSLHDANVIEHDLSDR
jgi:hypothetical protein